MTHESNLYKDLSGDFASHDTVRHSTDEYVCGEITTNTIEGYFSVYKRLAGHVPVSC
jgi:hypothetical protein